jgi:CelD/BcsL family acetyltransferase involved in cellulose biosynthesis
MNALDDFQVQCGIAPPKVELAALWRELEAEANCSFFQGWDWTGCLFAERFPDPVLARVTRHGQTKALALFNRRGRVAGAERLLLGESGTMMDQVFLEHNGPLVARDAPEALPLCLAGCLAGAVTGRMLVLSGVNDAVLAAARQAGVVHLDATRWAPFVDLGAMRRNGNTILDLVSSNTRYQLRRSARRYEQAGAIVVRRAETDTEAMSFLDALAALHQATWRSRGRPGAFATPEFRRFHAALIGRGVGAGRVDLLEISAGARLIGYLLNFVHKDRVYAYQSGFNYADAGTHEKPGLVCHFAAIGHYAARGLSVYDFLAGDDRYKASFAGEAVPLHWVRLGRRFSPAGEMLRLRNAADAMRSYFSTLAGPGRGRSSGGAPG